MFRTLLLLLLIPLAAMAQNESLSLQRRMEIASHVYSDVRTYFAHWSAIPDFNLNAEYRTYLGEAINASDRRAFDLVTLKFFAKLHNGHTTYSDESLFKSHPLGFVLDEVQGKWAVTESSQPMLPVGTVVSAINGKPVSEMLDSIRPFVTASSERDATADAFYQGFLWPMRFDVRLEDGREVEIDRNRSVQTGGPVPPKTTGKWLSEGRIAYIHIPSFQGPQFELAAIDQIKRFSGARTIIIDVRGNSGGTTPERLLNALIGKPWRTYSSVTPLRIAEFDSMAEIPPSMIGDTDEYMKGYLSAFDGFDKLQVRQPALYSRTPSTPRAYSGMLIVLINRECASACDDFAAALKDSKLATLVGENTFGSGGQPFLEDMGDGIWFRVSTKREYFPDGQEFEGIGVSPDVYVTRTISDLKSGTDTILNKALQHASN
jgi:carboxyl-terminal processing protease